MTGKTARQEMFIAKRVQALAVMYLTRRRDLLVETAAEDIGFDLVVRLVLPEKDGVRQFGVKLAGALTKQHADKVLRRCVEQTQKHGPFAFPICTFFFGMEDNQGCYTWIAAPVVRTEKALLHMPPDPDCKPLGKAALGALVAQVDRWYDAFFDNLLTTSGGRV